MNVDRELYRGWLIVAVLLDGYWYTECHKPEGEVYPDTKPYETLELALESAKLFVQKNTATTALRQALSGWGNVNLAGEEP